MPVLLSTWRRHMPTQSDTISVTTVKKNQQIALVLPSCWTIPRREDMPLQPGKSETHATWRPVVVLEISLWEGLTVQLGVSTHVALTELWGTSTVFMKLQQALCKREAMPAAELWSRQRSARSASCPLTAKGEIWAMSMAGWGVRAGLQSWTKMP